MLTQSDKKLSMHLRGPMNVSQVAVYSLASTVSNQRDRRSSMLESHDVSDSVSVEIDVNVDLPDDWTNDSLLPLTPSTAANGTMSAPDCTPLSCSTTSTTTITVTTTRCNIDCPSGNSSLMSNLFMGTTAASTTHLEASDLSPTISHVLSAHPDSPCPCATSTATSTTSRPLVGFGTSLSTGGQDFLPTPTTLVKIARRSTDTHTSAAQVTAAAASWIRNAYYTSTAPAQATGLAFLANLGDPQKSGTFD